MGERMTNEPDPAELAAARAMQPRVKAISDGLNSAFTAAELKRPTSIAFVHQAIANLVAAVKEGAVDRIAALEAKVEAIEDRGVAYRGIWQAAEQYERGNLVTLDDSIWHANTSTRAKPGNGSKAWTLAVKRGADGKDG